MADLTATEQIQVTLASFGLASFSTKDFIDRFAETHPQEWQEVVEEYGEGGRGSGRQYSAYTHLAHVLNHLHNAGELEKLNYQSAPQGWGSHVIRYWSLGRQDERDTFYPDEAAHEFEEGGRTQVMVNVYERNSAARQKCLEHHGLACRGCGIDFEARYGPRGAGFIHVHHIYPVSYKSGSYKLDPKTDLVPVCPNCHAMIHRRVPFLTIAELRSIIRQ